MPDSLTHPPERILLATDLSCRSDRALDRAILLSRHWNAELIAAHVVEPYLPSSTYDQEPDWPSWRRRGDPVESMRKRLKRDLAMEADDIRVIVEEGEVAETLLAIAEREQCDLIVTGIARDETFGRVIMGSTVNRLVRASPDPILVVRDRAVGDYGHIVVATDFSEASLQALLGTSKLFPKSPLTIFHAYDVPFAGYLTDRDFTSELRSMEQEMSEKYLSDERIDPALRNSVDIVIEHGTPENLLSKYAEEAQVDLTVIGSHGRGAFFDALIGSTAKRLLQSLDGDLLIIHYAGEG